MKTVTAFFSMILLTGLLTMNTHAQDDKKDQWFVVWQNNVLPHQVKQYEEAVQEQVVLLKKYNHTIPYYVYATDDYYYYWVTPIENLAAFDELTAKWLAFLTEAQQNEGSHLTQKFKGTINYLIPQVFKMRSDLTYFPPDVPGNVEKPYFRFGYCYVILGYEREFEENWKKCMEPFREHNISIGVNLYEGVLGTENPFYLWGETYENEVDMSTTRAKAFETMGGALDSLWPETVKWLRKIEYKTGWFRADLSYIPQN